MLKPITTQLQTILACGIVVYVVSRHSGSESLMFMTIFGTVLGKIACEIRVSSMVVYCPYIGSMAQTYERFSLVLADERKRIWAHIENRDLW